jgi:hypothetical protein
MPSVCCKWCHKPFHARQADINRGWGKYCSKSCKASHQEKRTGGQYVDYLMRKLRPQDRKTESERMHDEAMESLEQGWDGHKDVF